MRMNHPKGHVSLCGARLGFGPLYFEIYRNDLTNRNHFHNSRNMETSTSDDLELLNAAASFAALGSEQRLSVLRTLVRAGSEGVSIGTLGERSGVTGSTLTHHVKILAQAGLVTQERQGRSIICAAVAFDQVRTLSEFLLNECCADAATPNSEHNHG